MNLAAMAIMACVLSQEAQEPPIEAPVVRRRSAPAVQLDDSPREAATEEAPPYKAETDDRYRRSEEQPREPANHRQHIGDEPDEGMAPVDAHGKQRLRPPELLSEALETPREGALVGKPLTLRAALARSSDRQQQYKIATAYWRLCTAQADYHWSRNQRDLLAKYTEAHTNAPGTLGARASARADVRDAQLAVAQAQQELADLLGENAEAELPLASDRPHVGDYRTYYESIFGNRQPPPRIRLIHRTLPVRRKAIDAHGEAIVAALDALEAIGEDFERHGKGLDAVLTTMALLGEERRAFMAQVRDYNLEIAEYAFAVAPPEANGETLVSMLIKTSPPANGPPRNRSGSLQPPAGRNKLAAESEQARQQTANYQPRAAREGRASHEGQTAHEATDDVGEYQGLLDIDPPQRVQKLANLLHWDRSLPNESGEPTSLADCLRDVPVKERLTVIDAYWHARELAACYQVLAEQFEHFNALHAIAIELHREPGMAEASVRLQAPRRAARAAMYDAHVRLLAAEFALTAAAGRRLDDAWLLPSTVPQSGRYLLPTDHGQGITRHAAEWVRLEHEKLENRSDAVIQADAHRAALLNEIRAPKRAAAEDSLALEEAMLAVARQNRETLEFLEDLTGYNGAIARFALAVSPESISNEELVKKLVVARSTKRDS